jgi:hypothetical protein
MSNAFKDRGKAEEAKWAHDEALRFKVMARRNKLLGQWAAGVMGISGPEAEDYARAVVAADFEEVGEEDVFRKIRKDFDARSIARSDHAIRRQMEELLAVAAKQIMTEVKD